MSYRTDDVDAEFSEPPADRLRRAFGPEPRGDLLDDMIDRLETSDAFLFDSAEQVHLDRWRDGRVVLVGDSAWCATLYSGMGVSLGLSGADLLGATLERHTGDVDAALAEWEEVLRPHVAENQQAGLDQRMLFVPDNQRQILLRRGLAWAQQFPPGRALAARVTPDFSSKDVDIVGTALRERGAAAPA